MSWEGYYQLWCPIGHYWEGNHDYPTGGIEEDDQSCPYCDRKPVLVNVVDDTNCEESHKVIQTAIGTDINGNEIFSIPELKYVGQCERTDCGIYELMTKDGPVQILWF